MSSDSVQRRSYFVGQRGSYTDALVAQILAASTYPTQVVQADRCWLAPQCGVMMNWAQSRAASIN